jgi:hypothetical protein
MIARLALLFSLAGGLSGCITPQELYKGKLADDAACRESGEARGGALLGCVAGSSIDPTRSADAADPRRGDS